MGYLQDFEQELRHKIDATQPYAVDSAEVEQLVKFVKEHVLESYKNGTKATKTSTGNPDVHRESRGAGRSTKSFSRR